MGMDSFSLCVSWRVFLSSSATPDSLAGYSRLGWYPWSFRILSILYQTLLASKAFIEKSVVILMGLCVACVLVSLQVPALSVYLVVFTMICHGDFLFWLCLFGVLCAS